jgi:flagellar biosynthesis protein FlhG
MVEMQERIVASSPKIVAVGGGKGGVGKSTVSILLAFWLARMGKKTILVDADLGGANLHTFMGIKNPPRTLNDFVNKRYDSLEEIFLNTEMENLYLIAGASDILSLANIHLSQKVKLIQNLARLDADYIVLDLGAGTSYNVLDFFLAADKKVVVITPQPTSIHNAYAFIRNTVYRRLSQLVSQRSSLQAIIKTAMDTNNELKIRTVTELLQIVQELDGKEAVTSMKEEIRHIRPFIVTNMSRTNRDKNAGRVIQVVADKYLMIHSVDLGSIVYDQKLYAMATDMLPLTNLIQSSDAFASVYGMAMKLIGDN